MLTGETVVGFRCGICGKHLVPEPLDGIQSGPPIRDNLLTLRVLIRALPDGDKPVRKETDLPHELRKVRGGYELEVTDWRKLDHSWRALHGDLEVLVLVEIVGERCDGASRVRLDDDVHELELGGERVEPVRLARVVPNDPDVIIPDVRLFAQLRGDREAEIGYVVRP